MGVLIPNATITRKRPAAQTIGLDGRPAVATYTDTTFLGHHEPMNDYDRETLPEYVRTYRARTVFAPPGTLRAADTATATDADLVTIPGTLAEGGGTYRVMGLQHHRANLVPHDKALCVQMQEFGPETSTGVGP